MISSTVVTAAPLAPPRPRRPRRRPTGRLPWPLARPRHVAIGEGPAAQCARCGCPLFAYVECDGPARLPDGSDPIVRRWWDMMAPYMVYADSQAPKTGPLEEVFHLD